MTQREFLRGLLICCQIFFVDSHDCLLDGIWQDLWRHDQYFGTEGSTSSDHARIPPLRLRILRKPALRRKSTASAERLPLRQCATISPEESLSGTQAGSSPSGIKCPLRLQT